MTSPKSVTYAALKQELDETLLRLQANELGVDESLDLYKRGMEIVLELEAYLKKTENTVNKIKHDFEALPKGRD